MNEIQLNLMSVQTMVDPSKAWPVLTVEALLICVGLSYQ